MDPTNRQIGVDSSGHTAQPFYSASNAHQPRPTPHSLPPSSASDPSLPAPPQQQVYLEPSQPYGYHPLLISSQYHPPRPSEDQTSWSADGLGELVIYSGVPVTSNKAEFDYTDNEQVVHCVASKNMWGCPEKASDAHGRRVVPYSFTDRPHHFQHVSGYPQGPCYPASQYCIPPPSSYCNIHTDAYPVPETWDAPPSSSSSQANTRNLYQQSSLHPYGANYCHKPADYDRSAMRGCVFSQGKKKRKWMPVTHFDTRCPTDPKERKINPVFKCGGNSNRTTASSKTVRRRKKMYSDFVGVTYNKTHAKYQACITHYRKQHYLGRYKLAVDAALAYDESARLLKGSSWKVNFPSRRDYEVAKCSELERFGKMGGSAVDVAGSLAAVAMKVEEIASNVGLSGAVGKVVPGCCFNFEQSQESQAGIVDMSEHWLDRGRRVERSITSVSSRNKVNITPSMLKVTPSPTLQTSTCACQPESPPPNLREFSSSLDTPLSLSPDAIRHTMGLDARTPDSVIRPVLLTYKDSSNNLSFDTFLSDQVHPLPRSTQAIEDQPKQTCGKETSYSCPASKGQILPSCDVSSATCSTSPKFAPLIQNGTLAAASALMTLFGNEKK